MKTVYLVRHAKSSWDYAGLRDIERPLNDRGLKDAPMMAKLMHKLGVEPDALISSPAVRALTTATFFKVALQTEGEDVLIRDEIYEASSREIMNVITMLPQHYNTVMLFGHNPTFTSVANLFTKNYFNNIPTCGIVRIDAQTERWSDFSNKNAAVKEHYFPKDYL